MIFEEAGIIYMLEEPFPLFLYKQEGVAIDTSCECMCGRVSCLDNLHELLTNQPAHLQSPARSMYHIGTGRGERGGGRGGWVRDVSGDEWVCGVPLTAPPPPPRRIGHTSLPTAPGSRPDHAVIADAGR